MKRFFLLSLVALLGLSLKAVTVNFLVWDDTRSQGGDKVGCQALKNWATSNNIGSKNSSETDGKGKSLDSWNIPLTYTGNIEQNGRAAYEKYEIDVNSANGGVIVSAGDPFCLHIQDGTDHKWPHYNAKFPETDGWFIPSGETNMTFGAQTTITKIKIYRVVGQEKYCIRFNDAADPTAPELPVVGTGTSPYVLQVWDYRTAQTEEGTSAPRWDTSGGLFRVWEGIEGVKDGERYPIDPKYLRSETINNYTYKWLCFHKVDDIAAEETAIGHPLMWATKDYDKYKQIVGEGKGFDKVDDPNSELYVIDFSVPGVNDGKGIYIEVPSLEDVADGGWDSGKEDANSGLRRFFRGGIRFEFTDLRDNFSFDNYTSNYWGCAMRFVKWGHVFRLNEVARPLNAFPVFHPTERNNEPNAHNPRKLIGWSDDFGPCEWNGYDYTPVPEGDENYGKELDMAGKGHNIAQQDETKSDYVSMRAKKRGDSRIVAEYPFWLKKIYLQVVQDPQATLDNGEPDTRYKRFYLSFEGEYDLSAAIKASSQWAYKAPENDNHVSDEPNIFHGEMVQFNEPAFSRFYNLDLKNITEGQYKDENGNNYQDFLPLLGCRLQDYLTRIGHADLYENHSIDDFKNGTVTIPDAERGHYLYMMEYHKGYEAKSVYELLNASGDKLAYTDVPDVKPGVTYDYKAENGNYYDKLNNDALLETSQGLVPNTKFVKSESKSLFFDPTQKEYAPTQVAADYTFNFPNQPDAYKASGKFLISYTAYDFSDIIPLKAKATWRNPRSEGKGRYGTNLIWGGEPTKFWTEMEGRDKLVGWTGFRSHTPVGQEERFPVVTYEVAGKGSASKEKPAESEFIPLTEYGKDHWTANTGDMLINNHIVEDPVWAEKYYVHYHIDAWYNIAYMQGGVYSEKVFTELPQVFSTVDGAVAAADAAAPALHAGHPNVTVTTGKEIAGSADPMVVYYQIRPQVLHGYDFAEFDNTITPVTEVSADASADAPAEYYTLQGIRIDAPVPGTVCIVRRGSAVTKELIR